jgi:hypothetical protein
MQTKVKERPTFSQRCAAEMTRDVIFLLRTPQRKVRGIVTSWKVEGVCLSREEATEHAERNLHNLGDGWQVYGVCANGELAELLKST